MYFLIGKRIKSTLAATMLDATETPLNPNRRIATGVRTHISTVQNTMNFKVVFTLPIAFKKFVSGTEIDANNAFNEKNTRETSAGSHF